MIFAISLGSRIRIHNAAREPEIADLENMLCAMGARVTGAGTSVITVEGRGPLSDVEYTLMPDRIEAATYITALACTGGCITLENACPEHIMNYINILRKCGMDIETSHGTIYASKSRRLKGGVSVTTMPYPGFATDTQSLLMAVLSLSDGVSLIRENIFENRFLMSRALVAMGADIRIYRRTASVRGVRNLVPVRADIPDLRSGAALAAAMMSCEGVSTLGNVHFLDRGYEDFCGKYRGLGVNIERIEAGEE